MRSRTISLFLTGVIALGTGVSDAAIISVSGRINVTTTVFPGEINVGDKFDVSLTLDDSVADTNSGTYGGSFNNALKSFSISPDSRNTGTWTLGTFGVNPGFNVYTNANGESFGMQLKGDGFSQLGGSAFLDLGISWGFAGIYDLVATGSGQTLRQQFGNVDIDFAQATSTFVEFRNASYDSAGGTFSMTGVSPVPEIDPNSFGSVLAIVLGSLGLFERRRLRLAGDA